MRAFLLAALVGCASLHASILPTLHLDAPTLKAFEDYVAVYEKSVQSAFVTSGKLWIDDSKKNPDSEKPIVEPRKNEDVAGGSIHHSTGFLHLKTGSIEAVRRVMEDYPNYPRYYTPDVSHADGTKQADSTPQDEHYRSHLILTQQTLWIAVNFDSVYDTHYIRLDKNRWMSKSASVSLREMKDVKDASAGFYPAGDDHGFLWRTNTYWYVRERDGGLDLAADSMSLSRPNVTGFGWWGAKRSHDAVEKMLRDMKAAVESTR